MKKSIDAKDVRIGDMLGRYENRSICLPQFQRSFSWDNAQISTFWADLIGFCPTYEKDAISATYFLGPIVVLDSTKEISLLDGQQRIATSIILLAAIRDFARTKDSPSRNQANDFARDIQRELLEKDTTPKSYSMYLNSLDEPFFLQAIKTDPPKQPKITLRSHKLISSAYSFFLKEIQQYVGALSEPQVLEKLRNLRDALTKGMKLVEITVQNEDDAFQIFETLNDRGLRLSVPDLLANLLIRRCSNEQDRKAIRQKWNNIITMMGKRDISRFLRHMWISQYGDIKARGLYSEIKNTIEKEEIVSIHYTEQCESECEDYLSLLELSGHYPKSILSKLQAVVKYLRIINSFPLLLSGKRCLNDSDFEKLISSIISIYVRHSLISNLNPNDLESAFYEASLEIRGKHSKKQPSSKCYGVARTILYKLNPQDDLVEEKSKDLYLGSSEAMWFMTQIANAMQSHTKEIQMDEANLEHIFPRNPSSEWSNRDELQPFLWHIGNLTVLGERINQKAKNKSFKDKRDKHYRGSEIEMTKKLLNFKDWGEQEINARAAALSKYVIKCWI